MAKILARFFLILSIGHMINQFNVHGQSTIPPISDQQISNLTLLSLLSYTSQSSVNANQTASSFLFKTMQSTDTTTMMATVTAPTISQPVSTSATTAVSSVTTTNMNMSSSPTAGNITIPLSTTAVLVSSSPNHVSNFTASSITAINMNASVPIANASVSITSSTHTNGITVSIPAAASNHTRPLFPTATNITKSSTIIATSWMIIFTHNTKITTAIMTTVTTRQPSSTTLSNLATKYQQHITLTIFVHFLLFIFPFH